MSKPEEIKAPSKCPCGSSLPWHLFEIADEKFSHHCVCGRIWKWKTDTTAVCPKRGARLDFTAVRAAEKAASRKKNADDLASGKKTAKQLNEENGLFSKVPRNRVKVHYK